MGKQGEIEMDSTRHRIWHAPNQLLKEYNKKEGEESSSIVCGKSR